MVLWLSTDFGDFRTFWWGSHPNSGCFQKRDKNFATDDIPLRASTEQGQSEISCANASTRNVQPRVKEENCMEFGLPGGDCMVTVARIQPPRRHALLCHRWIRSILT